MSEWRAKMAGISITPFIFTICQWYGGRVDQAKL
jgi:hypothetical protein